MSPLRISVLPTLPSQAGASMRLYPDDLLEGLREISDVSARVEWPPFGGDEPAGRLARRWDRYVRYVGWVRRLQGDVFHIADHSNAQLLLALPGAQTVVTCHDLYPVAIALGRAKFAGAESRFAMAPTALRLSLLRRAAAIVAISKHTLEECRDLLGIDRARLFLGYYGISEQFQSAFVTGEAEFFRSRNGICPDQILILHVGSNDPRKNLSAVFQVVAALREKHGKSVCLVKVGDRFGSREATAIRTLRLEEAVRELGPLSAEETGRVYRAADVLLYPSHHEGFCRPVAEAMASGTPVVASNCGAIPEVAPRGEVLFAPTDVDGMAHRIVEIAESSGLREELAERGRETARRFTWKAHGEAVAEAYRAALRRWV